MLDVTLAFFCALALFAFCPGHAQEPALFLALGLALGLAFLTKSALGLFPLIVTLLFLLLDRQWKVLSWGAFWGGLAVEASILGWWCWTQYQADGPKFMDEHLRGVMPQKIKLGRLSPTGPSIFPSCGT